MNLRDISKLIFELVVRLIGLAFLYQGITTLSNVLANLCTTLPHIYFRLLWPSLVLAACQLTLAYWMVQGAPRLMRLAYKKEAGNAFQNPGATPSSSVPLERM